MRVVAFCNKLRRSFKGISSLEDNNNAPVEDLEDVEDDPDIKAAMAEAKADKDSKSEVSNMRKGKKTITEVGNISKITCKLAAGGV